MSITFLSSLLFITLLVLNSSSIIKLHFKDLFSNSSDLFWLVVIFLSEIVKFFFTSFFGCLSSDLLRFLSFVLECFFEIEKSSFLGLPHLLRFKGESNNVEQELEKFLHDKGDETKLVKSSEVKLVISFILSMILTAFKVKLLTFLQIFIRLVFFIHLFPLIKNLAAFSCFKVHSFIFLFSLSNPIKINNYFVFFD
jgi:hypothetical protein